MVKILSEKKNEIMREERIMEAKNVKLYKKKSVNEGKRRLKKTHKNEWKKIREERLMVRKKCIKEKI